jgi:protein-disulfide isomerase
MTRHTRRQVVIASAAAIAGATAGCLGGSTGGDAEGTGGSGGGQSGTDAGGGAPTTAADARTLDTHPAARDLDAQPALGPADASATIVAFEDPSCPRCRAFEQNTVPRIRRELVDAGRARFVARTYPVIYEWGRPAVQALEATFARSDEAFWRLFEHYFAEQDSFETDNVLPRTETWLADNTALDAAAVVADAEAGAYDDAVQVDLAAGEAASVGRTTPTVFLFRDGAYVTRAGGSVSFELITSALSL